MSETEAKHLRLIGKWIAVAESDYDVCRLLHKSYGCAQRQQIAFHAQQSAEKYIKTWLELKKLTFPYTHDISRLLDILAESGDAALAESLGAAEVLTPYAVQFRYPFEGLEIADDEVLEVIDIASKVRRILRDALGKRIQELYGDNESEDVRKACHDLDLWRKP